MDKNSILIFDNNSTASALENILGEQYNVKHILDTVDIAQEIRDFVPDVVFLNIDSPNGIKNVEKLNEMNALVIATTTSSDVKTEILARKAGAKACIGKPLNPELVVLCVADLAERAQERKTSLIDGLAQISNRRNHDLSLKQIWQNAVSYNAESLNDKQSVSIIMLDIDHFKKYNDAYGHLEGDKTIKAVAQAAKGAVREGVDLVSRWGGEEFAVILPNASAEEAKKIANRINKAVYDLNIPHRDNTVANRVTVSVGVSTYEPNSEITVDEALKDCDEKLYIAKNSGRNTVCDNKTFWNEVREVINDHKNRPKPPRISDGSLHLLPRRA